ncbi:alpha/beta hydrolase [Williamsia sp.]|uniref:alpha/beta hydrolase n=1 Tax=Williamsia sp. TaxID=1872085 RepID=UPI002F91E69E
MITRIRDRQAFHPDLRLYSLFIPQRLVTPKTLPVVRRLSKLIRGSSDATVHQVAPGVSVRLFRPATPAAVPGPAILWIHGGGMVMGTAAQDDATCSHFAAAVGATVASVEYRLAPEHPYPIPVEDCYAALRWLAEQPEVDADRIAVAGASAGGGLAATVAVVAHDRGEITPAMQLLVYPMLDNRSLTPDERHRLWDAKSNRFGWESYLGDASPEAAVPALRADLSGLAPAWIGVGSLDLFYDEDLAYAARLEAAGVPCTVEVVQGAFHGFDAVARSRVAAEFLAAQTKALRSALRRGERQD